MDTDRCHSQAKRGLREKERGEGKTTYTFSVSVNAFSVEFLLACYQQAGRVWYVSGALRRTYMLFYPAPERKALKKLRNGERDVKHFHLKCV
jgi:hypothetical protein